MGKGKSDLQMTMVTFKSGMGSCIKYASLLLIAIAAVFVCSGVFIEPDTTSTFGLAAAVSSQGLLEAKILPPYVSDEHYLAMDRDAFSYLTIIDAGSSGCRAHVFRFGKIGDVHGPLYILPQHETHKVKPGLSTFADHPSDAGASLADLITFLRTQVPADKHSTTPVWLKATAGLRMLKMAQQDAILESVRTFLGDPSLSPFLFRPRWASVISGKEEGATGWLAYNYLMKIVGPVVRRLPGSEDPYATIEMGGASSQVTQRVPSDVKIPPESAFSFVIDGEPITVYTHSYLGFGGEQGREALNRALGQGSSKRFPDILEDPCLNNGLTYSRGNDSSTQHTARGDVYDSVDTTQSITIKGVAGGVGDIARMPNDGTVCMKAMQDILEKSSAPDHYTGKGGCKTPPTPLSFNCAFQPTFLARSTNVMVFENFYYAASGGGVRKHARGDAVNRKEIMNDELVVAPTFPLETTPLMYRMAARRVCSKEWGEMGPKYPVDGQPKDVNVKLCFSLSYAAAFLMDGVQLKPNKQITVAKNVNGSDIEWALGAAYMEAASVTQAPQVSLRGAIPLRETWLALGYEEGDAPQGVGIEYFLRADGSMGGEGAAALLLIFMAIVYCMSQYSLTVCGINICMPWYSCTRPPSRARPP